MENKVFCQNLSLSFGGVYSSVVKSHLGILADLFHIYCKPTGILAELSKCVYLSM